MDALSAAVLKRFEERMVVHLRRTFPVETRDVNNTDFRRLVHGGIERAESYGVTDNIDLERFLELTVRYGSDFDTRGDTAWAGEILNDPRIPGDDKMNALEDHVLFEQTLPKYR